MAIIYIRRAGDDKEIKAYYDSFIKLSDEELVNEYNQRQKKGIIGSHYEAIYLIAMDRAFKEKFNKSPIYNDNNLALNFTVPIKLVNGELVFESQISLDN